jgi:hypothetical protein
MNIQHSISMTMSSRDRHAHRNSARRVGAACNCQRAAPSQNVYTPDGANTENGSGKVIKRVS